MDVGPVRYKQVLKKLIAAEQAAVGPTNGNILATKC